MKSNHSAVQSILLNRRFLLSCGLILVLAMGVANLMPSLAADQPLDPKTLPTPKRIVVPKLNGTVKLDGDLDEPMWKKAAVLKPFSQNDGSGRVREQTEVRLWYDDTALY